MKAICLPASKTKGKKVYRCSCLCSCATSSEEGPTYDILAYRPWLLDSTIPHKQYTREQSRRRVQGLRIPSTLGHMKAERNNMDFSFRPGNPIVYRLACVCHFPSQLGETLEETGKNGGGEGFYGPPKETLQLLETET